VGNARDHPDLKPSTNIRFTTFTASLENLASQRKSARARLMDWCAKYFCTGENSMGLITPNDYDDLRSLYNGQLRYLLSTENQIVKGLQSMIEHAQDEQLKQVFQSHLQETQIQAQRLERMIGEVNGEVDDKKDPIITALIGSGVNIVRESSEGPVRDAGLLATAQKIEHYEIASYGSAREWANTLGETEHAQLLQQTLDEEKHADELLNRLAQRTNLEARAAA